jgi:hypothetical protein
MYRVLAAIACLLLIVRPARAAEPEKAVVLMLPESNTAPSRVVSGFDTLRAQLGELSVHLFVESAARMPDVQQQVERARAAAKQHGALGAVWFDDSTSDKVSIYVYDASHARVARRVLHSPEVDAAAAEELAVVVRAAIDALLTGEVVAMEVVPKPSPTPSANEGPAAPPFGSEPDPIYLPFKVQVRFGVGYEGTSFARGTWQNGGAFLLFLHPTRLLYFGASYAQFPTLTLETPEAEARIVRHPVEVTVGLLVGHLGPAFGRTYGAFELAGLLDVVQRTTVLRDPLLTATPRDMRLRWGISPRARFWVPVIGPLQAFVMGGADLLFGNYDFLINSPGGQFQISQRAVRARVEAGIAVALP